MEVLLRAFNLPAQTLVQVAGAGRAIVAFKSCHGVVDSGWNYAHQVLLITGKTQRPCGHRGATSIGAGMKNWDWLWDVFATVRYFVCFWLAYMAFAFIGGFAATSSSTTGAFFKLIYDLFDVANKLPHLLAGRAGRSANWTLGATFYGLIYAFLASVIRQRRIRRNQQRIAIQPGIDK